MKLGCTEGRLISADYLAAGPVLASVSTAAINTLYGFFPHPLFLARQAQAIAKSLFKKKLLWSKGPNSSVLSQ